VERNKNEEIKMQEEVDFENMLRNHQGVGEK
jgi:hypothetical protein